MYVWLSLQIYRTLKFDKATMSRNKEEAEPLLLQSDTSHDG